MSYFTCRRYALELADVFGDAIYKSVILKLKNTENIYGNRSKCMRPPKLCAYLELRDELGVLTSCLKFFNFLPMKSE
jgi:hypothetical protein